VEQEHFDWYKTQKEAKQKEEKKIKVRVAGLKEAEGGEHLVSVLLRRHSLKSRLIYIIIVIITGQLWVTALFLKCMR
jgi:hypothetical protein